MSKKILKVGIIGCGEVAQVAHIATLNHLSNYFTTTYLCDVSPGALSHAASKVAGSTPQTTQSAQELITSPNVDVVLLCNATAFHPSHAILSLQHNKHVLVEKPLAFCYRDLDAIAAAEAKSTASVFVGYMRRYSSGFLDAVRELDLKGDVSKVQYARVRDIIGPNSYFVNQSGTYPVRFQDISETDAAELKQLQEDQLVTALRSEFHVPVTDKSKEMLLWLGHLGTHDLSAMRELLGAPLSVLSASLQLPIWTVTFQYPNFPVVYESGTNSIPVFDAHIEVYTETKIVRVNIDTPYVKGLPTTMTVREKIDGVEGESYQERVVRSTYEDPYTREFKEWWGCVVEGREIKTSIEDARGDVDIFRMVLKEGFGTV